MVNLLITMNCNRSCSYCFAKEKIHSYSKSDGAREMSLQDFEKATEFLLRSNQDAVQLAGGEPTLHSSFKEIVLKLIGANIKVNVLSNALWDANLNDFFKQISPLSLGFLLNIDNPKTYGQHEWSKIEKNLSYLKDRSNVTLSFNIKEIPPDYGYIFKLVSKYDFKFLRLSFSMPVHFGERKNSYLPIDEYKEAAKYVIDFVQKGEALGSKVGIDNALPICMFTTQELNELMLKQIIGPERNFVCYPAIDIGPDLSIWRCFGTSKLFNKKLSDFNNLLETYEYYQRVSRLYQFKFSPLIECTSCNYRKEEKCQGGCIGFAELRAKELGLEVREISDEELLELKPALSKEVSFKRYQVPKQIISLRLPNGNEISVPESTANLILQFDGVASVRELIARNIGSNDIFGDDEGFDNLFIAMASQKVLPVLRSLLEQKVLAVSSEELLCLSQTRSTHSKRGHNSNKLEI